MKSKSDFKRHSIVFIEGTLPWWKSEPAIDVGYMDTYPTIADMEAEQ
jgi:hypothetical protein